MKISNNHYNKALKPFARQLRNHSTKSEVRLWCELLRNKQMLGYQFLRQRPIDRFIADFMCKELKLIIELDGVTHQDPTVILKDEEKDKTLSALGYAVLRFTDQEVMKDLPNVQRAIENWILSFQESTHMNPTPQKSMG
ncbi:MAG: endonuclease domain-containing protein [Spirosomataceae bacterium]